MAIERRDDFVTDAQGRALAGAQLYVLTQPANTSTIPPSPLATIYFDIGGTQPITQPVIADGFGHTFFYASNVPLYTLEFIHPLFGSNPVILPDQLVGGGAGGGAGVTVFQGVLLGTINGVNTVFTLTQNGVALGATPLQATVWDNFPLINGVGYSLSGTTVTFAVPPQIGDTLYGQGLY